MPFSVRGFTRGLSKVLASHQAGKVAGAREREARDERRSERDRTAMLSVLNERLLTGQLEDRDAARTQGGERRRRIAEAAAKLRANPRFTSLADLPDEELIDAASDLILAQTREAATRSRQPDRALQDAKAQLGSVERQVDDTRAEVRAAEREQPKRPLLFLDDAAQGAYREDSTQSARRLGGLRQRADSLEGVRDSLASVVQQGGRDVPGRDGQDFARARARALELQREGKSRAEILRILRAEGFNIQ